MHISPKTKKKQQKSTKLPSKNVRKEDIILFPQRVSTLLSWLNSETCRSLKFQIPVNNWSRAGQTSIAT